MKASKLFKQIGKDQRLDQKQNTYGFLLQYDNNNNNNFREITITRSNALKKQQQKLRFVCNISN